VPKRVGRKHWAEEMKSSIRISFLSLAVLSCSRDSDGRYEFLRAPVEPLNEIYFNTNQNRGLGGYSFNQFPVENVDQEEQNDATLSLQVRESLLKDKTLSYVVNFVNIRTKGGVVTLSGTLKSHLEIARVIKKVKAVHGVTQIVNNLRTAN
jgi:hypothetical protein